MPTIHVSDIKSKTLGDEMRKQMAADDVNVAKLSAEDKAKHAQHLAMTDKVIAGALRLAKAHPGKGEAEIHVEQGNSGAVQVTIVQENIATGSIAIAAPPAADPTPPAEA